MVIICVTVLETSSVELYKVCNISSAKLKFSVGPTVKSGGNICINRDISKFWDSYELLHDTD